MWFLHRLPYVKSIAKRCPSAGGPPDASYGYTPSAMETKNWVLKQNERMFSTW